MEPVDRGKRKMVEKDHHHHGRGRPFAASSSGATPRGHGDRGRHDLYIEDEERQETPGFATDAILDTP
jgi:hypothetical protein